MVKGGTRVSKEGHKGRYRSEPSLHASLTDLADLVLGQSHSAINTHTSTCSVALAKLCQKIRLPFCRTPMLILYSSVDRCSRLSDQRY